jgi:hypothetical protein
MDFKQFFNEQSSLAPLGMVIPTGPVGALPTQVTGTQIGDMPLSSGGYMGTNWVNGLFDLMLPSKTVSKKITKINDKVNPILIVLDGNTTLYIPPSVFRKIKVPPEVGRTLMVKLQRRPEDNSQTFSSFVPGSIKCF